MNNFGQYAVVTSRTINIFRNLDDVILFFGIFCKNVHNSKTNCSSLKYKTYLKRGGLIEYQNNHRMYTILKILM